MQKVNDSGTVSSKSLQAVLLKELRFQEIESSTKQKKNTCVVFSFSCPRTRGRRDACVCVIIVVRIKITVEGEDVHY